MKFNLTLTITTSKPIYYCTSIKDERSKLEFYVLFNSQVHIEVGRQLTTF